VRIESLQKSAQLAGVLIGPALNVLFIGLHVDAGWLKLNPNTMAGYFPAILNFILLLGFRFFVDDPPRNVRTSGARSLPCNLLLKTGSWACLVSALSTNLQMTALDVLFAPLAKLHLGWGDLEVSGCFAALAVLSAVGTFIGIMADKKGVKSLKIILTGCILNVVTTIGTALTLRQAPETVPMVTFMVFGGLGVITIFTYTGATGGLYQQCCAEAQGLLGGLYLMCFAGGRPFGALLAGVLIKGDPAPLCWLMTIIIVANTGILLMLWRRLSKADEDARANKLRLVSGTSDAETHQQGTA